LAFYVEVTFWISQGKIATTDRWSGQIYKLRCQILSGFHEPKIIKIS